MCCILVVEVEYVVEVIGYVFGESGEYIVGLCWLCEFDVVDGVVGDVGFDC